MKQSKASKTLLAILTILTVMMALIVPSPAYAAKEPPPPPPPPSNDTGGKGSGPSHSSAKDLPDDTTLVVTENGTPVSLAAQLTVDALSGPSSALGTPTVKFCPEGADFFNANCKSSSGLFSWTKLQDAIDYVKNLDDGASGVFYVATNYSTGLLKPTITLDQSQFFSPTDATELSLHGGINFSGLNQGTNKDNLNNAQSSTLKQPFSISHINDASSFSMDHFVFNIETTLIPNTEDGLSVVDSNHVTLSDLTINDSKLWGGNGIGIYNSTDVTVKNSIVNDSNPAGSGILIDSSKDVTLGGPTSADNVTVNRSGGLLGDGITIKDSGAPAVNGFVQGAQAAASITLQNVTVTNTNPILGDGIHITDSHNIFMDAVSATSQNFYGAYLNGNSDGLTITNSTFNNAGYAGLSVSGQSGAVTLTNVTADNNGGNVADVVRLLLPESASGAAFLNNSGTLTITGSMFGGNAASGLWVLNQTGGVISIADSIFAVNAETGLTALTPLLTDDLGVYDSSFIGNGGNGLTALSAGNIFLNDSSFIDSGGDGASATSLIGNVAVDPSIFAGNTGNGLTAISLAGDVTLEDSAFYSNGENGALASAVLGGVNVQHSLFSGNLDNGLTALALDTIYLGNSDFFDNGADGAFATSLLGNIGVDESAFARNEDTGLIALASGGIIIGNSGFFRNGEDGAFTTSLLSDTAVINNVFAGNQANGLTTLSQGDVILGDSGFFRNGGDGAFVTSLSGGIDALDNAFVRNGENGLTALSAGDILLAGSFAGANEANGAELTSGLGNVVVLESVFGTPFGEADLNGGGLVDFGNGNNGLVATTLVGDVVLGGVQANQNGGNGIEATTLLGDIYADYISANNNDVIGALLTSVVGSVDVEDSQFDINGGAGLVALGMQDVFLGWSEASGNQYAGAALVSQGDVVVTNSQFLGVSQLLPQAYAPQMLGLGVLGGDVTLDSSNYLPFASGLLDPVDYGVNASGNGVMGALVLSDSNIQIGDSVFDENGASVASLGLLSLLGDGVVAIGGLDGNGGMTGMWNTEATGNTSLGAVLFSTDFVGVYDSAFDSNGLGGLLGVSFGDMDLGGVDASGNTLLGAATLSGGSTTLKDSTFDNNYAGVGLLSVAFGPVWAENVDASGNGILGAGLVSLDLHDLAGFSMHNSACSEPGGFSGDVCVTGMTANDNGFLGAAILGTDWVEVNHSQFTGNDSLGSLGGIIPGGGLVVIGGESTVLDEVNADKNYGFGAVVGNTGGVYDLITSLMGVNNNTAGAINQAVTGSATAFDLSGLPLFTDTGNIAITDSSFSNNDAFGLLSVSEGDISLYKVNANDNGGFGASLFAEGNIDVSHSRFNDNEEFGLMATIFSPDAGANTLNNTSHTVTLDHVKASGNDTFGAEILSATPDQVDVSVTHSTFNHNEGAGYAGLGIFTNGDVFLDHVAGDSNAGSGAVISGNTVTIRNSHFNYNNQYGLRIDSLVNTTITDTDVCYNHVGPDHIHTPSLFTSNFNENCEEGGSEPTVNPLPWQIINVMMDPGKNSGTLSCQFGTTFLYLQSQTAPTPDFEWARAVLSACIVPGGSIGTFLGLAEGALPGPLPSGITFQGKAFDLSIVGPNGQPIDVLGSPMMVRFTLPDGFTLPSGKKLDILWWDPAGKQWVELNTYVGGNYAWGYAGNDGTFALAIK